MSRGRIVCAFGDGVYAFALFAGQLEELEEKADAGPMEIYRRLLSGNWRTVDVRETIRLSLLGGGEGWVGATLAEDGEAEGGAPVKMTPPLAMRLVSRYVDTYAAPAIDLDNLEAAHGGPLPWSEASVLASRIMGAGLMGKADEPLGKKTPGETEKADPSLSPAEKSDGPPSSPASPIEE